jgi:hypothetical protein
VRDPALVTETIAQILGAKDSLASHIAERELLLLLDNLEQVIEAAPGLSELLSACPNLTLLVTSRELLRISGEVEYAVLRLPNPKPSSSSVPARSSSQPRRSQSSAPASTRSRSPSSSPLRARRRFPRRRSWSASPLASTCSRAAATQIPASRP